MKKTDHGGENGALTVSWRKPKNAPTDTYKAMALYTTAGITAASEASAGLSIENEPVGLIISVQ